MMNCIFYEFEPEYRDLMIQISTIIYHRAHLDDRAHVISFALMTDEGIRYVEEVFNHAIKIGRLAPFDVHSLGVFLVNSRLCQLRVVTLGHDMERVRRAMDHEQTLLRYAAKLIPDLKPPPQAS